MPGGDKDDDGAEMPRERGCSPDKALPERREHQTGVGLGHWGDQFPDTNWTMLIGGSSEDSSERCFTALCKSYWYPLYAYLRKRGRSSHDAQDLTQGFFAYLLGGDRIGNVDPNKGKFRSYLLGAMEHFVNDQRKYQNAQKRGGGQVPISIEEELAEHRFRNEPADELSAEKLFDRKWAMTVIDNTKCRLGREYEDRGRGVIFEEIGDFLTYSPEEGGYTEIAARLAMTEESVRAQVSRMRKRFKILLREQVRATVGSEEEIDDEIRHLLEAFC